MVGFSMKRCISHEVPIMHRFIIYIFLSSLSLTTPVMAKEVVGWVEKVRVFPGDIIVKAKIDTGAKTSSINCSCITPIERNGEKWVRFSISNYKGEEKWLERKIIRTGKIKRHFGEKQERFVIKLGLCLGRVYKEADVNLIDRSGLNYELLIGRRFIEGTYLIDPGKTFLSKPSCRVGVIDE